MTQIEYFGLEQMLDIIEEPNRTCAYQLLNDNMPLFSKARGSSHNHQAWEGGYLDHITEVMNIAIALYFILDSRRKLLFSLSDALLVLFLHDLEKPWRYYTNERGICGISKELADKEKTAVPFVEQKTRQYNFKLSEEHWNGIKYAEGEKNDYSPNKRIQTPLAAFVHMCDVWSARGWYDYPLKERDSWKR